MITKPEIGVSVCMAPYNGQDYVAEQIGSIVQKLSPEDELVVVDDASADCAADVVRGIKDPSVVLMPSRDKQGNVARFEKAITASRDEYVMLSDQDDLWIGYRPYYGCTKAFRAAGKKLVLPFPVFLTETHDQWIGLVANLHRDMIHVEVPTVARRLHAENTMPKKIAASRRCSPCKDHACSRIVGRHHTKAE